MGGHLHAAHMGGRSASRLERLWLRGFRNLADLDLTPGPRLNVVAGENGQGKSNLLESIYYLGALASFRLARKEDLIAHGADRALVAGRFVRAIGDAPPEALARTAKVKLPREGTRALALDDKRPRSTAAWVGALPMVLFHPGDLALASGAPELRRAFLDRMLEQMDPAFARARAAYEKALRSRNRLLKADVFDPRAVSAYDALLATHGAVVGRARARLVDALKPLAERAFVDVAGQDLPLSVDYQPRVAPEVERLRAALAAALEKDRARGFTADGPHADELALTVRARGARHHASQGQHRMMVLALKVAELEVLTRELGCVPVLLLDDVSSELDRTRNQRLFDLLDALGGQVFLTTTHPELIRLDRARVDFQVRAGQVELLV